MPSNKEIIHEYAKSYCTTEFLNLFKSYFKKGYKEGKKTPFSTLNVELAAFLGYTAGKKQGMYVKLEKKRVRDHQKFFAKLRQEDEKALSQTEAKTE